ncbi:MAG: D-alanine--D-alanine ligase [Kiloniellales bacterium]
MTIEVAVLMGGWSVEREISLVSGAECAGALRRAGYGVTEIDVGRDIARVLDETRPDVCFNALHGRGGEDGRVVGLLDIMGIPYTHSGVLASALAMDKTRAKQLLTGQGIRFPEGRLVHRDELKAGDVMERPYVIKPNNEGSSVGVHILEPGDNVSPFETGEWRFGDEALVERYVPGRELTIAVMGDRPLAVTELRPKEGFYNYEAKYTEGWTAHLLPASLPPEDYQEALGLALLAHQTLGCRGVSRADLRYDDTGSGPAKLYMLEVNTQPGMTPLSLVPEQARHVGISFEELVVWMVENAACDA